MVEVPGARSTDVKTPFLLSLLFLIQSTEFLLLSWAASLAAVVQDSWDQSRATFTVAASNHLTLGINTATPEWEKQTTTQHWHREAETLNKCCLHETLYSGALQTGRQVPTYAY